ncbi:flagellar basal body P-ring formation chaperone FlgA [Halomonas sp. LR5S13]|uniref:flagellar basal body P-ring formation chaperone FlgA n=1 Tax=Halomonas rhizosphaerae TaxID=3043296 RepID=UPI0024A94ED8|nr:flagellar basal body P-ring formation chaperone FlgA [Halomonas rhizosphaerae]MDI5922822.1 flagellar basal body P-ring formation chaperone FlgA [Halomonas rhizosphaerae]
MPGALWPRFLCLLLLLFFALPGAADDRAMLERVQALLYERASALGDEVVIEISPPSARLGECENPTPFLPNPEAELRSRVSVGVRCGEDGRQVRYLQASVEMVGSYVEMARRVERGQPLSEKDLTLARGNLARLPGGTVIALEDAIGQHATRPLAPGQTLQKHHVQSPRLVYRGDSVQVEASGTGFRVHREGEAIDEGGMGDSVRVRLPDRLILEGKVLGPGRVAVDI